LPLWCRDEYVLEPRPSSSDVSLTNGGYLSLSRAYVAANPSFSIQIGGFTARYVTPHPYTNQHTLSLARGPVIYCAEDADNEWEKNHFKNATISRASTVTEESRVDDSTGEEYIALKTTTWQRLLPSLNRQRNGEEPGFDAREEIFGEERELVLIPYYFRANRTGKGQMRVGLPSRH
jgi:DUF1680 family protein